MKNWFYGRGERWLLVFDSADSIDDENDPAFIDLKHFLPNASSVHMIITTRSSKAKGITSLPPIEVGSMEVSEAVELFSTCSDYDRAANQAKIEMIVQELGCLALAVTLTGSYVGQDLAHGELCAEVPALSPQEAMELMHPTYCKKETASAHVFYLFIIAP